MIRSFIALIILNVLAVQAKELRHFNPAIFGKSVDNPIKLLLHGKSNSVEHTGILTDIKGGKFYAATITYPESVSFEEARSSLNKLYKKYEKDSFSENPNMGLWRDEDKKFAIQLTEHENVVRIVYISFMKSPFSD